MEIASSHLIAVSPLYLVEKASNFCLWLLWLVTWLELFCPSDSTQLKTVILKKQLDLVLWTYIVQRFKWCIFFNELSSCWWKSLEKEIIHVFCITVCYFLSALLCMHTNDSYSTHIYSKSPILQGILFSLQSFILCFCMLDEMMRWYIMHVYHFNPFIIFSFHFGLFLWKMKNYYVFWWW